MNDKTLYYASQISYFNFDENLKSKLFETGPISLQQAFIDYSTRLYDDLKDDIYNCTQQIAWREESILEYQNKISDIQSEIAAIRNNPDFEDYDNYTINMLEIDIQYYENEIFMLNEGIDNWKMFYQQEVDNFDNNGTKLFYDSIKNGKAFSQTGKSLESMTTIPKLVIIRSCFFPPNLKQQLWLLGAVNLARVNLCLTGY